QRLLGDLDEAGALGVDAPDGSGERGIAVPTVDDRPAVDRDDVALLEHPGPRDALDDALVRRRADPRGGSVIPQESRLRTAPLEDVAPDLVELCSGDTGEDRSADAVVHLRDDPASLAHDRDLGLVLAHAHGSQLLTARRSRAASMTPTIRASTSSAVPTP